MGRCTNRLHPFFGFLLSASFTIQNTRQCKPSAGMLCPIYVLCKALAIRGLQSQCPKPISSALLCLLCCSNASRGMESLCLKNAHEYQSQSLAELRFRGAMRLGALGVTVRLLWDALFTTSTMLFPSSSKQASAAPAGKA